MRIVFGNTDTGLVRKVNQDRFACGALSDTLSFGVLCDGMGGEAGGGIASDIAVKFAEEMLKRDLKADMTELSIRAVLTSAVSGANALVFEAACKDESLNGMGTTMIVAAVNGDNLYVAYVGDSRVYVVSPESERQLTKDHTVVQMLLDTGKISAEDALSHPKRHYITRAVGVGAFVDADFVAHTIADDEIVLLCSDGMYNYLAPDTLYELLTHCASKNSAKTLMTLAKTAGGADNITAVVMARVKDKQ